MRRVWMVLLLAYMLHAEEAAMDPVRTQFATDAMAAIKAAGETRPLRFDAAGFRILIGADAPDEIGLGNRFAEYQSAPPEARPAILASIARSAKLETVPTDWEQAREHLYPVIRSRGYFEHAKAIEEERGKSVGLMPHPLADHLAYELVYDFPQQRVGVSDQWLKERWKKSWDEARDAALANLRKISREPLASVSPGLWQTPWKDNYDPSRLLLIERMKKVTVQGELIAMPVNRDTLLLTGSEDVAGLAAMARATEQAFDSPRFLTGWPLKLSTNAWVAWQPPPGHPLHHIFGHLRMRTLYGEYQGQAPDLEQRARRSKDDVFVGAFTPMRDQAGAPVAVCSWTQTVRALLPRTDRIIFVAARKSVVGGADDMAAIGAAEWDAVQKVCGELLKPVGVWPERYRVDAFPTVEQQKALGLKPLAP